MAEADTFNPMMNATAGRRGSQLEQLQQEQERQQAANAEALAQASADILLRKQALDEQER